MAVLVHSLERFEVVATTLDDSVGNTFDKFARELGLPWQSASGALVEQLAADATDAAPAKLPRIMLGQPAFSYAGLKSAASRAIAASGGADMSLAHKCALAHEFQQAAFAPLEDKVVRCVSARAARGKLSQGWFLSESAIAPAAPVTAVVCSGGVASNRYLRDRCVSLLTSLRTALDQCGRGDIELYFPPPALCVDNAVMIAWAGHLFWDRRTHDMAPHVLAKWPL